MADMTRTEQSGALVFLVGGVVFLYQAAEMLSQHTDWSFVSTPPGVGEIFVTCAAALAAMAGALFTDFDKLIAAIKR